MQPYPPTVMKDLEVQHVLPWLIGAVLSLLGHFFLKEWTLGFSLFLTFGAPIIWFIISGIPEGGPADGLP